MLLEKRESLFHSFAHKKRFAQKTKERIPYPDLKMLWPTLGYESTRPSKASCGTLNAHK